MKWKKYLLVLMLAVPAVVLFAGGAGETQEEAATGGFNASGLPIVNTPITLHAVVLRGSENLPLSDLPMFTELEKATNVRITWEEIGDGYDEKKNLMLASGELPDLFWGPGLSDLDIMTNLQSFVPLKQLINDYAPNIQAFYAKEPIARKMSIAPDGEIYSLSQRMPHRPPTYGSEAINKQWIDTLGLQMPRTVDDLYQVFKAFKAGDPNGNGVADEIPLTAAPDYFLFEWFWGSFGMERKRADALQVTDGKIVYLPITENYKAMISYLHRLSAEGLLDKETFTQKNDTVKQKAQNPGGRIIGAAFVFTIESTFGAGSDKGEYVPLPPLSSSFGKGVANDNTLEPYNRNVASITIKNKYPEATMRWLDQHYTEDMSVQLQYGSLGYQLEKTGDGQYRFLPLSDPNLSYDAAKWMYAPANFSPMGVHKALEERIIPNPTTKIALSVANEMATYIEPGHAYPNVFFSKDVSQELVTIKTDIDKYVAQMKAKWVVEGGIESEWDSYVDRLNRMGLQRMLEIYQKGYDNFSRS